MMPLSLVEAQPPAYLWRPWIPLGEVTLIGGDPEAGKTSLFMDVAAHASRGRSMPGPQGCGPNEAVNSLIFENEESRASLNRKAGSAGADAERIFIVDPSTALEEGELQLPQHIPEIREQIEARDARLVVFSPVNDFIPAGITSDRAARSVVGSLTRLARDTGAAIVLVGHLTKGGASNPIHRIAGSRLWAQRARSVLLVGWHPDDLLDNQRVLAHAKSSEVTKAASLQFGFLTRGNAPSIEWGGTTRYGANDLVRASGGGRDPQHREAVRFLYDQLRSGPVLVRDLQAAAIGNGIAWRTVARAKQSLGVTARHSPEFGGPWQWEVSPDNDLFRMLQDREVRTGQEAYWSRFRRPRRTVTVLPQPASDTSRLDHPTRDLR
jgi:hypothetical protein